jgi:hypothetical protein
MTADVSMSEAAETQPRMYAGKYKSIEDLERGYTELQKSQSSRPDFASMDVESLLQHAGVTGGDLATNWQEHGTLTEDQYTALRKVGLGKEVVDTFLRGQQAMAKNNHYQVQQAVEAAASLAGGRQQLENLFAWANNHYDESQLERFQTMADDPGQIGAAVKEMMFDWKNVSGQGFTSQLVNGQAMPNAASGFESVHEFIEAMGKARKNGFDAAFQRRLANTPQHILRGIDR